MSNAQRNQSKLMDVRHFGAVGDGTTDDSAAIAAALAASRDIEIPAGYTFRVGSTITLPNANVHIHGGGTLTSSAELANGIFYQTHRGVLTEIGGVTCTGKSPLFRRYATDTPLPWADHYLEYRIRNVNFLQDATSYAAYFYGAREGSFTDCHFETCKGVYSDYSINMDFIGCTGKNAVQFVDAQAGSEGIKFIGGSALGMTYCVKATGIIGLQIVGVMWDYNDNPVHLTACQQVGVTGSYITSRSTTAHVIHIVPDGATRSEDIYIVGNPQLANVAASGTGRIIHIVDADLVTIQANQLKLWRDVGVHLGNCTHALVRDNKLIPYPAAGNYSVQTATEDSTVTIRGNTVTKPLSTVATRSISGNPGFTTEASGEVSLASGATSRTITHTLAMTPLKGQVQLTPTSSLAAPATKMWVSAVSASTITVAFDAAPGSDTTVNWSVWIDPNG